MTDPFKALLDAGVLNSSLFPPNSRYHGAKIATVQQGDGELIAYLRRRFVPPPEKFIVVQEYTVVQGDRLDNLSARFLGDAELYWRICDANGAIRPADLIEIPGQVLAITLPEGIPGASDA